MKIKAVLLSVAVAATLFAGCAPKNATTPQNTTSPQATESPAPTATTSPNTDVTTTASIVNTQDAFLNAVSPQGTWIIAILNDLTIDKDIVVDGQFKNSKGDVLRKLALYTQDENKVVTNRFTLTAPRMIVRSENTRIQSGTFKGDVYVEAKGFHLLDGTVDGNIYFKSDDLKASFTMDETSKVTGTQSVKALQ